MSRWIDADAFKSWIDEYVSVFKKSDKAEIKGYISHQPSIEIIRCRECKAYDSECEWCGGLGLGMKPDDFCSYGSRSEKPNNCETCRFELYCPEMCEGCCEWDSHYEPKDEPQTERSSE